MITSTIEQRLLPFEVDVPDDGRTQINESVWFVDSDGYRVVFCRYEPLYRVAISDTTHLRMIAVYLRQAKLATQPEIAQAFGHSLATQGRWERQYQQEGLDGLMPKRSPGRPPQLNKGQEAFVAKWFHADVSNMEMARRLGVGETTIRRTLKRLGLQRTPKTSQPYLPVLDQDEEESTVDEAPLAEDQMQHHQPSRRANNRPKPAGTRRPTRRRCRNRSASIAIRTIAAATVPWPGWGNWKMPCRCSPTPRVCRGRESCWPCRCWSIMG